MDSIFDTSAQHNQVRYKIIAGLDRVSQALRSMMWEHGKSLGLTPIQIQCLVFLKYHDAGKRRAGQLAKELDVTPATISQAIRVLIKKDYLEKQPLADDARIQVIELTSAGKAICAKVENWANGLLPHLEQLSPAEEQTILSFLMGLISALQQSGQITVARQCNTCRFFRTGDSTSEKQAFYCKLLEQEMSTTDLRVDCAEHETVK